MDNEKQIKQELKNKIFTIIGIVLCALLLPILIMNVIMIINSYANKDEAPSIGKYVPFIVQSGSMAGVIEGGDIIITKKIEAKDVEEGDIITFYDPKGNGTSVVTHRVFKIECKDGKYIFTTVGDVVLNENIDQYGSVEAIPIEIMNSIVEIVPEDKLISEYSFRIPVLGSISLFMSTVPGFIVCVLLPLLLLIGYDIIRRKMNDKANAKDTNALLAELEALRAEKAKLETQNTNIEEVEGQASTDKSEE